MRSCSPTCSSSDSARARVVAASSVQPPASRLRQAAGTAPLTARHDLVEREHAALTDAHREALKASSAGSLTYGLRPESVRFADTGMPGTLRFTEPTGPETYATVETSVGNLTLRVPGYMAAKIGDAVHVAWTPESVHLFDATNDQRIG